MPASTAKSAAPANGSTSGRPSKAATPASTVPPSPVSRPSDPDCAATTHTSGKPDKSAYDAEQNRIKSEIDVLQARVDAVREKMRQGSRDDKRNMLRAELDTLREELSSYKTSRVGVFDQLKALQDGIQKKTKDLHAARGKTPFRTVAEVDTRIKNLEEQVESGSMKLADEKRALQEISQAKRARKTVEGFQAAQHSIDADKSAADELRQQLDNPEFKTTSDRYDKVKAELDELKKESDEAHAKLIEERDSLQSRLDALFNEKRSSAQQFRETSDWYWAKVNEDRARRAEQARAQRAAKEAQKKLEHAQRLQEEASLPAFQTEIEDCQTLIDALSGKSSETVVASFSPPVKDDVAGVPKLELRQVEASNDGLIARKKKGEDEETYFVGKGKRGKKDKGPRTTPETDIVKNLPIGTVTALSKLAIALPTAAGDIPRVVEDLRTKKAWYESNQARVTAENIAKAEEQIQHLTSSTKLGSQAEVLVDLNGDADTPIESVHTPVGNNQIDEALGENVGGW